MHFVDAGRARLIQGRAMAAATSLQQGTTKVVPYIRIDLPFVVRKLPFILPCVSIHTKEAVLLVV